MRRTAATAVVGAAFLAMLNASWRRWPDVLIDFGQTLYVALRLSQGAVLQRDVVTLHGPLSHYFNATLFRLFGVSMDTIVFANLVLLALLTVLLYRLLEEIAGAFAATGAAFVFVLLFAFSQYVGSGNYNYVTPYVPEIVHGLILGLLAIFFATRERGAGSALTAGFLLGLAFLTKAEVFAAAAAAVVVGARVRRRDRRSWLLFALGFSIPILASFLLFLSAVPADDALLATLGPWPSTLSGSVSALPTFRRGMGTDTLAPNLARLARGLGGEIAVFLPPTLAAVAFRRVRPFGQALLVTAVIAEALLLFANSAGIDWANVLRPAPVFVVSLLVAVALRRRDVPSPPLALSLLVFALVLLAKMILNVRLYHYGFVLAMPATLLLVAALLGWIPNAIEARGGSGTLFSSFAIAMIALFSLVYVRVAVARFATRVCAVGVGADAFLADWRGCVVRETLERLRPLAAEGRTLVVLPEGVMLNYLARAKNPTPFTTFMPPEMAAHGESAILSSLERTRPDCVVVVEKDLSEWGLHALGRDYALSIAEWLRREYREDAVFGKPTDSGRGFGLTLLLRKDATPP